MLVGRQNTTAALESSLVISYKTKCATQQLFSWAFVLEKQNLRSLKHLYTNAYGSFLLKLTRYILNPLLRLICRICKKHLSNVEQKCVKYVKREFHKGKPQLLACYEEMLNLTCSQRSNVWSFHQSECQ